MTHTKDVLGIEKAILIFHLYNLYKLISQISFYIDNLDFQMRNTLLPTRLTEIDDCTILIKNGFNHILIIESRFDFNISFVYKIY
jgi:hypothetical protein